MRHFDILFNDFMHDLYINSPPLFGMVTGLLVSVFVIVPFAVFVWFARDIIRASR